MSNFLKTLGLVALIIITFGAICWGVWGFFHVEVLALFFGPKTARVIYCIFGVCGIYGIHIFVDYAKKTWRL